MAIYFPVKRAQDPGAGDYGKLRQCQHQLLIKLLPFLELFLATVLNGDVDNAKLTTSLPGSSIEWNESLELYADPSSIRFMLTATILSCSSDITTPEFSFSLGLWKKTSRTKLIREFTYRHDDSTDELKLDGWHYFHDSKPYKPIRSVLLHLHYEVSILSWCLVTN